MRWICSWNTCWVIVLMAVGFSLELTAAVIEHKSDSVRAIRLIVKNSSLKNDLERVTVKGRGFLRLRKPEHISSGTPGHPDLPVVHRLIVVDPNKVYETKIKVGRVLVLKNSLLYPVQPDYVEGDPQPAFVMNRKAYNTKEVLGAPWVEFGTKRKLGRFTVMPVKIHLAQFHPMQREIHYFDELDVQLFSNDAVALDRNQLVNRSQLAALENLTINGDSVVSDLRIERTGGAYLVLTSEDLLPMARNFADRHRDLGYQVHYEVIAAGTSSAAIKATIQKYYTTLNLESVLLFGDETKVKLHSWGGTPGDSFYSFVDGDDYLADVLVGRIPVSTVDEAEKFLQKTMAYEDSKKTGLSSTKKVMLVAHRENYPGKYTSNLETVRMDPNLKSLEFVTQYGGQGAKNQTVIDLTSQNFSIINYRGHGSTQSWSGWGGDGSSFGSAQINLLKNINENIAVFFNIACSNGALQSSSKSMAERLLWPQGENPNRGAIAVLAATEPSLTAVNHKYNRNLFAHLQQAKQPSLGLVNLLATNQLVRDNGGSIPSNNKMYILFGDPLVGFKHD